MKGSKKQFSKFLNSELNDDSLEVLEKNQHQFLPSDHKQNQDSNLNFSHKKWFTTSQPAPKQPSNADMIPLTAELIDEFTRVLGYNAMQYYSNIVQIKPIKSQQISDTYKDFYTKFETVPVLFLSTVPKKDVYLWQVNRLCPYQKNSNLMIVDSKSLKSDMYQNISILMLALITPEPNEEILQAKIIGDTQISIKSKIGPNQLAIRIYSIKDFVNKVRINPCKQELTANEKCSFKLVITASNKTEEALYGVEVTLINYDMEDHNDNKNRTRKIEFKPSEEFNQEFYLDSNSFSEVFQENNGEIFIVDKQTATIIACNVDSIGLWHFNIGEIRRLHQQNNKLFMTTSRNTCCFITFEGHHAADIKFVGTYQYDLACDKDSSTISNEVCLVRVAGELRYRDDVNLVYNVPLSMRNPFSMNGVEVKKEKKAEDGIEVIKGKLKSKKDGDMDNEERKEVLKQIRTAMKLEIKKSNDPNQDEADKGFRVPKDTLELYQEIKLEKKLNMKQKEKEKAKVKTKMRNFKDNM